ncbi:MAG TPA: peptide deformylase [Polyangiaceae bacterium]
MAIRKIAQLGEPLLRQIAAPVPLGELGGGRFQALIDDMIETMRDADGAGLAAPQIYEPFRLAVIEVNQNPRYPNVEPVPLTVLVNPVVTPDVESSDALDRTDAVEMYEGCLSVPGVRGRVRRPRRVRVTAIDRAGRALDFTWEGVRAAIVQHELDHLDGVLFVDRADPKTLTFLREYERHVPVERRILDRGQPVLGAPKAS